MKKLLFATACVVLTFSSGVANANVCEELWVERNSY